MEQLAWQEYGLAGVVVGVLLSAFIWWIRAARSDLNRTQDRFITHLETTGERQTEAIVASTVATKQSVEALRELSGMMARHDATAAQRHDQVMRALTPGPSPDAWERGEENSKVPSSQSPVPRGEGWRDDD